MDFASDISWTSAVAVSIRALAFSMLLSIAGCSRMCMTGVDRSNQNAVAHAGQTRGPSHRPAGPFMDGAGGESEELPPQLVNVFGEVNGVSPRAAALSGEIAFQQHTFADEGYDSDVVVDPTGKWLAFSSTRNSEHPGIFLQRVDGTAVTQLSDGNADDAYPVFSPDGKQIAFSSTRAGNWQIFVMDADGRNIVQVTNGPMQAIHPSFSPDGSRIVYCAVGGRSGQWELWTVDLKTSEKRTIGYGLFPNWSPNPTVNRIAFQRARQRGSRWFSLWTLDLVDGEARRATEVAVSSNAAILSPAWSPDGKRLAFATVLQPGKGGEYRPRGQTDIWTVDADGTNRQRLTDGHGNNLMPFWAADNRVYFISDRGGAESVWSVRAESMRNGPVEAQAPKKEKTTVGATDAGDATGH
jgi:TolB protein